MQQQLLFARALNEIAQVIIENDTPESILEETIRIVGETLAVDRTLIYDVSFDKSLVTGLCEWSNPAQPDISPVQTTQPLSMFISGATEMWRTRHWLESHIDAVNHHFRKDGSAHLIHEEMHIQSLLWYPFAFYEEGYHVLVLAQRGR